VSAKGMDKSGGIALMKIIPGQRDAISVAQKKSVLGLWRVTKLEENSILINRINIINITSD
jgi:hypothetical protein